MKTPVKFELAKLLKEKGWDTNTYSNCWVKTLDGEIIHNKDRKNIPEHDRCEQYLMQPTIAEVVMWLYEKHGIWIECLHRGDMGDFTFKISKLRDGWRTEPHYIHKSGYNSPTESYEAAIEYCLTNLI